MQPCIMSLRSLSDSRRLNTKKYSAHNEIFSENNFRPSNNHDDDRHLWGSIWQNECGQTQSSQNCWRLE